MWQKKLFIWNVHLTRVKEIKMTKDHHIMKISFQVCKNEGNYCSLWSNKIYSSLQELTTKALFRSMILSPVFDIKNKCLPTWFILQLHYYHLRFFVSITFLSCNIVETLSTTHLHDTAATTWRKARTSTCFCKTN
jgi:hypothetical protein